MLPAIASRPYALLLAEIELSGESVRYYASLVEYYTVYKLKRHNSFMDAFEHVLGRYRKAAPSKPALIACPMAYATNIELGRMADISNPTYQELTTTAGNFIRLETLKEANDRIANATARLPVFRHFDIVVAGNLAKFDQVCYRAGGQAAGRAQPLRTRDRG